MRLALRALLAATVALLAAAPVAAAPPEQRDLEEEDAKAEALLSTLLTRHGTPKGAADLVVSSARLTLDVDGPPVPEGPADAPPAGK